MTKRTAEQTLRDEIARSEREFKAARERARKAEEHVAQAEALLAESLDLVVSARSKLERSKRSLEALLGGGLTLEERVAPEEPNTNLDDFREETIALASGSDEGLAYLDREATIAAATGVPLEVVRESKRTATAEKLVDVGLDLAAAVPGASLAVRGIRTAANLADNDDGA